MKQVIITTPLQAQKIQRRLFKAMSSEAKFELWSKLWLLGKALNYKAFSYGRPARASGQNRKNFKFK